MIQGIATFPVTAVVRQGRGARLAAIAARINRRPGSFIDPCPDTEGHSWYIVKTNPQCEPKTVEALLRVGIYAYCPVYRKRLFDPKSKRRITRTTPFILGYVFALLPDTNPDFGLVRDCDGVAGVLPLTTEQPPFRIPDRDIGVLRRLEARHWLEQDMEFRGRRKKWLKPAEARRVGAERPVIASGAFEGFVAAIARIEGTSSARVVTQVFGQIEEFSITLDDLILAA